MPRGSRTPAEPGWGLTADFDADLLEAHGMTSLLFETTTGFVVFNFYAIGLYVPNAIESIWVNFAEHFLAEDGINCLHNELVMEVMGHEASHAQTGARRKITAVYGGPPPYESRTTNITASLWL
ncbi:uncharacterized protein [Miscanthus floridulus]|uniref:uncharacterized protein n=1 Tax=Miscanthus floridulus TaxID=154761 RepID=UPI00345AA419